MRAFGPEVEQAAEMLESKVDTAGVNVFAARHWALVIFEEEGVALTIDRDNTEVFEAMRRRRLWSRHWRMLQSRDDVVDRLLRFVRERPDLCGLDR